MNTIQEIIELVDKLNDEAARDAELNSSITLRPFTLVTDGDQWHVDFLGSPCTNSEDYPDPDSGETYRSLILKDARAIHSSLKKFRLREEPLILGDGDRKVYMAVTLEVIVRANEGVNINEAVGDAELILQPTTPGWDVELAEIINTVITDSK